MLAFKALHVLSMFTAVTLLIGEPLFIAIAIWRRDVKALAAIHRLAGGPLLTYVGASIFLAGIVFGLLTVATGALDFFDGWLIAAYVLVAAILALNGSPIVQKELKPMMERSVEAEAGQRPLEEVTQAMGTSRIPLVLVANIVLFVAIILDMVLKPF